MSLSQYKSPGDVVSEMIMSRTGGYKGAFLVVEGPDDSRFFRARIAKHECDVVIAGGKLAVEGSIQKLDGQQFRGVVGVCDDDCTSLNGCVPASPNLLLTEARDLDTWLVFSPALERMLVEYGDDSVIKAYEKNNGSVRDNLARIASPFGRLRWLSARDGLGLNFDKDKLTPLRFVKPKWVFDPNELFAIAAQKLGMDIASLQARIAALPQAEPWHVCQGHDLHKILALGLRDGPLGFQSPRSDQIAAMLRSSLDSVHWLSSRLATELHQWESRNVPFRVL